MSQPKVAHRYRYDPLNRLIETAGIQRFYNTTRMATEIQGTVQHSVFQSGDVLLAQTRREGAQVDCTLLATDFQRSVLHGVSPDKVEPIAYNVYGHRPAHSGLLSVLGFNGERPDPITGHYLLGNGYRAFNPVLMRFNSPDSLSPFGEGGINCYGYCGGEPINRYDPTGHFFGFIKAMKYLGRKIGSLSEYINGEKTRRIYNVENLGGVAYQYKYKSTSGDVLAFWGHGSEPEEGLSFIGSYSNKIFAEDLLDLSLAKGTDLKAFSKIELVMCNGGSGDFAQNMANLTGLKTKAYEGEVFSRFPYSNEGGLSFEELPVLKAHMAIITNKGFKALKIRNHNYRPKKFTPR